MTLRVAVVALLLLVAQPSGRVCSEPDAPPFLAISRLGTNVVVVWAFRDLQSAATLQGPWSTLSNAASPVVLPATGDARFFRLR